MYPDPPICNLLSSSIVGDCQAFTGSGEICVPLHGFSITRYCSGAICAPPFEITIGSLFGGSINNMHSAVSRCFSFMVSLSDLPLIAFVNVFAQSAVWIHHLPFRGSGRDAYQLREHAESRNLSLRGGCGCRTDGLICPKPNLRYTVVSLSDTSVRGLSDPTFSGSD